MKVIEKTYWNGSETPARKCKAKIGASPRSTWWCANMQGEVIDAVEIKYGGDTFYIDNRDGDGWWKVTTGKGSPIWNHSAIPLAEVVP